MPFLNLHGISVISKEECEYDYHVAAETTELLASCPNCKSQNIRRFGGKDQVFMDCPVHGKRVGIYIKRKRYQCKDCGKTPFEPLPEMDSKRLCTLRLIKYIQEKALRITFTSIADEVALDEKTIRNIFHDYVEALEAKYQFETPRWLGIDEVHLNKTMRGLLTNIEERTLVDMLHLIKYLFRAGRGYSFEALRAKMLYGVRTHKTKKPKFDKRKQPNRDMVAEDYSMVYSTFSKSVCAHQQEEKIYLGVDISTLAQKLENDDFK